MKEIDSLGMKNRRKNRPRSHAVFSLGSDDCCIYDGYDKLLKFGIGIHQGIDVFSKNINWLMCFSTNKRPEHVALYYLRWVKSRGAIPQMTMSDCGTENTLAAVYQRILWTYAHGLYNKNEDEKEVEAFVKEMKPHRFVESIRNQAIGDSWIQLLHHTLQPLIDDFSAKVELGIYSPSDPLQRQVFLYVFLPNVQKRLDDAKELLNHRYKRKDRRSALPSGCSPSYAYDFPESFSGEDMKIPVPPHVIESLIQIYDEITLFRVHSPRFKRLCDDFMRVNFPETRLPTLLLSEAWVVYEQLLNYVAGIDSIDDMIGWVPDEDEETSSESETDDCNGSVEQVSL
ncbi:hypothetical protein BKA69DRAFT_1084090 [Paraphysoderma sedebokerense]|nr:hypothetical protein BKA69DRAFT_1084090 [Paraphysoderma sedebokerense]